jgi:hypothetical protein
VLNVHLAKLELIFNEQNEWFETRHVSIITSLDSLCSLGTSPAIRFVRSGQRKVNRTIQMIVSGVT